MIGIKHVQFEAPFENDWVATSAMWSGSKSLVDLLTPDIGR
jgi:hypothetical protein